ncbi:hypothetical protein [Rhodopila globiformis]|uniref:Uncharacterized protein n=1 Tax=Rhodopila globiformis TaxID=1071 RepID=A0A2S6NMK1_RHOGL|nr:hypothetical protein [Rhodopila globiformis]PPQ37435.1 hypothetical protein CCS01_03565 [Rhodopila globiformis]
MHRAPAITAVILEKVLAFLAPLFLDVAGDAAAAREAARAMLETYDPRTDRELRHAALAIAFSFGALDALSRSLNSELTANQVLRLRGNANALNRAALQNEQALEALREHPQAEEPAEAALDLPASLEPADLAGFARTQPVLSRQQRRALERQAEKAQRRQQEQDRLAQRASAAAAHSGGAMLVAAQ